MKELKSTNDARKLVDEIHIEKEADIHKRAHDLGKYFEELHFPLSVMIFGVYFGIRINPSIAEIILIYILAFRIAPLVTSRILKAKLDRLSNEMEEFFKFTDNIKPIIGVFPEFRKDIIEAIERDTLKFQPKERTVNPYREYWIEACIHLLIIVIGSLLFYKFIWGKFILIQTMFIITMAFSAKTLIQTRKIILS